MTVQQEEEQTEIKEESKFELDLSRQANMVPQDKIVNWNIEVFGVGSVGSHVTECLAKSGFKSIKVYDMDTVELENISPQAFDRTDIGKFKVDAVNNICQRNAGLTIQTSNEEITEKTVISPEPLTVYCCFFDSLEARRLVFEKLKGSPVLFVDGRIGKFDMRYYLVDCSDKVEVKDYLVTLDTSVQSEMSCGDKACATVNRVISGHIVMQIINYILGNSYIKTFIGNLAMPTTDIAVVKNVKKVKELTANQSQNIEDHIQYREISAEADNTVTVEEEDEDEVDPGEEPEDE